MKSHKIFKSTVPLLLSACSLFAHGEIVRQSVESSGQSYNAVYDSATSLQWLSPVATKRMSIDTVLSGAGGWVLAGFRFATGTELLGLLGHYGVAINPSSSRYDAASGLWSWSSPQDVDGIQSFVADIGWTYENNPPSPGSPFGQRSVYGILADQFLGDGQSPSSNYYASISASDSSAYAELPGGQWLHGSADSLVGSFLVRTVSSVPEPSSTLLIFTGLALLYSRRRGVRLG